MFDGDCSKRTRETCSLQTEVFYYGIGYYPATTLKSDQNTEGFRKKTTVLILMMWNSMYSKRRGAGGFCLSNNFSTRDLSPGFESISLFLPPIFNNM